MLSPLNDLGGRKEVPGHILTMGFPVCGSGGVLILCEYNLVTFTAETRGGMSASLRRRITVQIMLPGCSWQRTAHALVFVNTSVCA